MKKMEEMKNKKSKINGETVRAPLDICFRVKSVIQYWLVG